MATARVWTPERVQILRDRRANGVRYRDIAAECGVSFRAVKRKVYDLKLPDRKQPVPQTEWTDELVARATGLVADGYYAREVADRLGRGITKNAVIGKMQRLGIPFPEKDRRPSVVQVDFGRAPIRPPVSVYPLNVTFADLDVGQCKYPTTDDAPFLFCGHPQQDKSSYCPFHHNLCWVKPQRRLPDRATVRGAA